MNLTGKYTVNAPVARVWSVLLNGETLARITPAVTRLEEIEPDHYKAIADVKIGPVKGGFSGDLWVKNKIEHESFTLSIQQNSVMGNVAADMQMKLSPVDETRTEVSFNGVVRLSGTLSIMGQRVLSPVANMLSKQFFEDLEKELR